MRFTRLAWLFSLFLVPFSLSAQQSASTSVEASPLMRQAAGVLTGATSIADVTLTGTARLITGSSDETGTVVAKALATGESRIDLSFPSGSRNEVYANSAQGPVGSWSRSDGASGALPLHNLLVDAAWFAPALMLNKLNSSQNINLTYAGSEVRDGVAVQHLTVSKQFPGVPARVSADFQRLSQMEVFLDTSTALPVSVSFQTHPDGDAGRDFPVEIKFSGYQSVSGVKIPFHVQKYLNGTLILDLQLQKADLNLGVSVSSFSVPNTPSFPVPQKAAEKVVPAN